MWDPDCNATNTDNSSKQINSNENTIGICQDDKTNKCFQNKVLLAQTSDLNKDANMLNWCQAHVNECETPLKNYCKTVDNVSSPFCQKWCNNNPGECDKYIIDFSSLLV